MTRSEPRLQLDRAVLDAYRADQAESAAIQRAYLRFSWGRRKTRLAPSVFRWVLSGMALGLGAASAATLLPMPRAPWAAPLSSAKVMAPVAKKAQVGVAPKSTVHPEPPTPAALPTSAPSGVAPRAGELRGPVPAAAASTSMSTSDWQRAALALRTGELGAAEEALEKLEKSVSPLDRQAAELARAQLLVKRGMRAEATPALQRLAREGSSEVIRSQAASVLRGMSQ